MDELQDSGPSMEDTIREAMSKMGPIGEDKQEGAIKPVAEDAPEPEKPVKTRDEAGKFKAKEPEPTQPEPPKRKAPDTWKKEAAAKWDTLDPALQEEVERRENDIRKGIEGYRSKAERADAFERVFQPYMATIQSLGVQPEQAVAALMSTDHVLRYGTPQQKQAKFQQIANEYGIDVGQLGTEQPQVDPYYAGLEQRQAQLEQYLRQQAQAAQAAEMSRVNSDIDSFKANHPHLDTVREDMAALLSAGRAKGLDDAYDMAIWAKPELRATLLAEQQERLRAESASKASEARKAASVNVPAKGSLAGTPALGSMEDTIRDGARRLGLISN